MIKPTALCCSLLLLLLTFGACAGGTSRNVQPAREQSKSLRPSSQEHVTPPEPLRNPGPVVHVVVALCDNKYQGIVPVPQQIGNGDDPANNLYWGAGHGVKNFFRKAKDWSMIAVVQSPKTAVLERAIFKHKERNVYLVADAYRGREIARSTFDFLSFASGKGIEAVEVNTGAQEVKLYAGGGADLIAYVGHDGLMDFTLPEYPLKADERRREAIILSCISKSYFEEPLRRTGAHPLLWTTGLMAPEAYTLKAALDGWMLNESGQQIRRRAAEAYHKYQKCGLRGATNLFASGW